MTNLTEEVKRILQAAGADLVGFGSLTELPSHVRAGLPVGISVAVKFPKEVIRGISDLPTREYLDHYNLLNDLLDKIVSQVAEYLKSRGYTAIAQTRDYVTQHQTAETTLLPQKTVATRAGLGWVGKSALLVTREYGSMVRLSSILTDAPLETATPVDVSYCEDCTLCRDTCPADAITGNTWAPGVPREHLVDIFACQEVAQARSLRGFGIPATICGKCIEICPYTRGYLDSKDS